ncbi:MAG: hypothetical protein IIC02_08510 [Planctomycetes bacterium]|nr:hypothetical protein [Planctomycetota bacterium]
MEVPRRIDIQRSLRRHDETEGPGRNEGCLLGKRPTLIDVNGAIDGESLRQILPAEVFEFARHEIFQYAAVGHSTCQEWMIACLGHTDDRFGRTGSRQVDRPIDIFSGS